MSLPLIYSRAQLGMKAPLVSIETHLSYFGMPRFSIVGLPEAAVRESRDRVRSALLNMRFEFPIHHITINLAPADLPKEGGRFDLPIAMSLLAASKQIPVATLSSCEMVGELALSGELRPIQGVLPIALETKRAGRSLFVPWQNREEAALVRGLEVFPAHHILEVCAHLCRRQLIAPYKSTFSFKVSQCEEDMADIRGQYHAKRALEIAAAGRHCLLFIGPPGTGKTMLAHRLITILPTMTEQQGLETAAIASISQNGFDYKTWCRRPYRSPHHSTSSVALVGGRNPPQPGEISLAHQGVLFLDELPEFNRHVLESLREPLESGIITISRAACQSEFPADFQLIAAMNPCPCGYLGDDACHCRCSPEQVRRYRAKISGPLLDRIDMHVEVSRLPLSILSQHHTEVMESSETIRQRVEKAFQRQMSRAGKVNAKLSAREMSRDIPLSTSQEHFLEKVTRKLNLSARAYHRILKVARTIADLAERSTVDLDHLSEAISFRKFEG